MRGAYDGSVGFTLNINSLHGGVCKSCAGMHLAVLRPGALECGGAMGHARDSLARECGTQFARQSVLPCADYLATSTEKPAEFLAPATPFTLTAVGLFC